MAFRSSTINNRLGLVGAIKSEQGRFCSDFLRTSVPKKQALNWITGTSTGGNHIPIWTLANRHKTDHYRNERCDSKVSLRCRDTHFEHWPGSTPVYQPLINSRLIKGRNSANTRIPGERTDLSLMNLKRLENSKGIANCHFCAEMKIQYSNRV